MSFRFSLQSVLRLRQSMEEREKLKLQALLARRAAILRDIEQLTTRASFLRRGQVTQLGNGLTAAELHFSGSAVAALERRQRELLSQLERLEQAVRHQSAVFQQERRNREVLESVRDTKFRNYQSERRRHDQAVADELHLLQRSHRE